MSPVVAGRTASAPLDRQGAEERFTEIHREHGRRLTQWFYWHLPDGMRGRSEDLAQDVFVDLWEHLLKGRPVDYPFALLKRIGQRHIADQFAVRARDTDAVLVDITDPASPSVETVGCSSRYASGEPELALVAAELETAMERMRDASALWRSLHGKVASASRPDTLAKVIGQRDDALVELQEACRVVGNLRAELERAGGCAWRSSSGWPPSLARDGRQRNGALSDPTVKECPKRHCLADVESVGFLEDGTRVCRACNAERTEAHRQRRKAAVK